MSPCALARFLGISILLSLFNTTSATESPTTTARPKTLLTLVWHDTQGIVNKNKLVLSQLDALPQIKRTQQLPSPLGIPGRHEWQGVSLHELLKLSGGTAKSIRVMALNGYFASIPLSDVQQFDPLLAYRRDGQNLTIRDKGPFILVYPFDDFNELNQQLYINRSVWQIHEIHFE
ncbi:molybdopterin-dependent oxidoreductase [Ectopseudomonas mendocina]|uniref:Molybdopterin-dependent oxidoreductase n=1 Tax=Ectopseudomonas mendocina TaxID=300 RepID=A0ABZ2RJ32_ECTME